MSTLSLHDDIIAINPDISTKLDLQLPISLTTYLFLFPTHLSSLKRADLVQRLLARFDVVMVPEIALKKYELGAGCTVKLRRKKAENTVKEFVRRIAARISARSV
ncbi:uncharacterized protein EAF02_005727 [Botrytis sinoallii]|uniref:uncharacterized protein n=1 Tax=Botrytis sinoallii TaxID=1463999 RepID=UPI001901CDC3|nr:uncharacterized protein EAF02_005727 [Botrytis sinoallii]KAF7882364.1 hypothetical protein EAF02_005727 [Botrytis sinoallii]